MKNLIIIFPLLLSIGSAFPGFNHRPFDAVWSKRQSSASPEPLIVDLGYERYRGVFNATTGLNTFKGKVYLPTHLKVRELNSMHRLRYAASPAGSSRWQPPNAPALNRGTILKADARPPRCPQSNYAGGPEPLYYVGDEDCLFLSVYAPQNASQLPVLVYIREKFHMNSKSIDYSQMDC